LGFIKYAEKGKGSGIDSQLQPNAEVIMAAAYPVMQIHYSCGSKELGKMHEDVFLKNSANYF
jgi:hypothetical protein